MPGLMEVSLYPLPGIKDLSLPSYYGAELLVLKDYLSKKTGCEHRPHP